MWRVVQAKQPVPGCVQLGNSKSKVIALPLQSAGQLLTFCVLFGLMVSTPLLLLLLLQLLCWVAVDQTASMHIGSV